MREKEEELLANLKRSEFLVAMNPQGDDPKKISLPYLKNKDGKIFQPVFSDVLEFEKFGRGKKLRVAKLTFEKLSGIMMEQAEAIVVNPMGFNLLLNRKQMEIIAGQGQK